MARKKCFDITDSHTDTDTYSIHTWFLIILVRYSAHVAGFLRYIFVTQSGEELQSNCKTHN